MSPATPTTVATCGSHGPRSRVEDREPQRLSDRRLSRPEASRERLADDDHQRRPRRVGQRKIPPGDDGNAERREVAGVDDVPGRREHLVDVRLVARSHAAKADAFEAARRNSRQRRALDRRYLSDAVEHRPPECSRRGFGSPVTDESSVAMSTPRGSKPGSAAPAWRNARTNNAARTTSRTLHAIWPTTKALRRRERPDDDRTPSLSDAPASTLEPLKAGSTPKTTADADRQRQREEQHAPIQRQRHHDRRRQRRKHQHGHEHQHPREADPEQTADRETARSSR